MSYDHLNDPINRIQWMDCADLKGNDYNPNVVMNSELRLLETSLMLTGWVQPVLADPERNIIDGFHRWRLSQDSKQLRERYGGKVPVAILSVTRPQAIMLTIRMNRAKGVHVAYRMSDVVKELIDIHGCEREEIAAGIGATADEIDILYQDSIFKSRNLADYKYSKAWVPVEARRATLGRKSV